MDQGEAGKWEVRIQALLRKAESTKHDEERETILKKVEDLIMKWGLDRAVIEAKAMAEGAPVKVISREFRLDGLRGRTRGDLLIVHSWVAQGLGSMRGMYFFGYDSKKDKRVKCFRLIGFESDLDAYAMLISSIQMQLISGATAWWKNEVMMDQGCAGFPAHVRSAKKSAYMMGFAERVFVRLVDLRNYLAKQNSTPSGPSTELVLVDRQSKVDRVFEDMFPDLPKAKPLRRRYDSQGYYAGSRDGNSADLGQKRFSNTRGEVTR